MIQQIIILKGANYKKKKKNSLLKNINYISNFNIIRQFLYRFYCCCIKHSQNIGTLLLHLHSKETNTYKIKFFT